MSQEKDFKINSVMEQEFHKEYAVWSLCKEVDTVEELILSGESDIGIIKELNNALKKLQKVVRRVNDRESSAQKVCI